jgi:hypothetical protein
METTHHLHEQTRTAHWRLQPADAGADADVVMMMTNSLRSSSTDDTSSVGSYASESSVERHEREMFELEMRKSRSEQEEEEERGKVDKDMIRCPICTLWVPCR